MPPPIAFRFSTLARYTGTLLAALLVVTPLTSTFPAHAATPAPAPAAVASPLAQDTQDLLKRLESTNPAERQAAEKQLKAMIELFNQPEVLKQLTDATPDTELKSFFKGRIAQLKAHEEERLAANLPGVTLAV